MNHMRRGQSPTIKRGPYNGDELSVGECMTQQVRGESLQPATAGGQSDRALNIRLTAAPAHLDDDTSHEPERVNIQGQLEVTVFWRVDDTVFQRISN
jgi:hypothetical protein